MLGLGLMVGRSNPLKLILVGSPSPPPFGGLSNFLLLSNRVVLEQFRFWNLGVPLPPPVWKRVLTVVPFALAALLLTLALCRPLTLMQMGITSPGPRHPPHPGADRRAPGRNALHRLRHRHRWSHRFCRLPRRPLRPPGGAGSPAIQVRFSPPCSGALLLGADVLAAGIQPYELPNGVILALIGAPCSSWWCAAAASALLAVK